MNDISTKAIVLKMNKHWKPVGVGLVSKTMCDLMNGVIMALDIEYAINGDGTPNFNVQEYVNPVGWDEWVELEVRPWDLSIHTTSREFRVPTVVITTNYDKVHMKYLTGKPTKEGLAIRDNLIDGYTGKELEYNMATIDHVKPRSRGGTDTYDNTVLTSKEINNKKGNLTVKEAGLNLLINPHNPKPVLISSTIRKARHFDWIPFLTKKK